MPTTIPTYVVTGADAAAKTALTRRLLGERPGHESWAVLVNDLGPESRTTWPAGVFVRDVAGCICCTAQVGLRTAVVALVREARPQRLFVVASAAAETRSVLAVLREPSFAQVLAVRGIVSVAALHELADERYTNNAVYGEQLCASDLVALAATSEQALQRAHALLSQLAGDKPVLDADALDLSAIERATS